MLTFNSVRYISNPNTCHKKAGSEWYKVEKNDNNEIPFVQKQGNESRAKHYKSPVKHAAMFFSFQC